MNSPFLLTSPDRLFVQDESSYATKPAYALDAQRLKWEGRGVRIDLDASVPQRLGVSVSVTPAAKPLRRLFLRWSYAFAADTKILGDAWERSYGELEWRGQVQHRPMPWYFLFTDGRQTTGLGVETGASSLVSWRTDAYGITLELDLRCGGMGVQLGQRTVRAATIIHRPPQGEETPFAATRGLCAALCPKPLMPAEPVIGHNDWYWLFGKNSATQILESTQRFLDLCPMGSGVPRPWSVIDDGWQQTGPNIESICRGGPWKTGTEKFPDLPGLAQKIKVLGARPGIWMRPLLTHDTVPESWKVRTPKPPYITSGHPLDPSVPEVLDLVRADIRRLRDWGYELIKHDFSTFEVTGRWGIEMNGASDGVTADGWTFADRSRTTAEIILNLYRAIREAAGPETTLIGCNTISHLAAGLVEMQRTGDDTSFLDWRTSVLEWDRIRRMGVNTLAFRGPQHGAFYGVDADCVPLSPDIPWSLTRSWLELVAGSGTPCFLSINPAACGPEQAAAIKQALALAAKPLPLAEPLDWMRSSVPNVWKLNGATREFNWCDLDAAA